MASLHTAAATHGHAEVVEQLLKGNASVDSDDEMCAHASAGGVMWMHGRKSERRVHVRPRCRMARLCSLRRRKATRRLCSSCSLAMPAYMSHLRCAYTQALAAVCCACDECGNVRRGL